MSKPSQNASIELLNSQAHKDVKIETDKYNTKENRVNVAMVTAGELSALVHEYPIFMTKVPSTDELQLIALLGFKSGQNLYLNNNNWRATYLPLDITRKPFQAYMPEEGNFNKGHIAIDMQAEQVNYKSGSSLFDDKGGKTDYLKRIEKTFAQLMGGVKQTSELLKQAEDLNLIEGMNLKIEVPGKDDITLNGLFGFNKENVGKLTGESLELAHKSGLLQLIPLVLCSTLHMQKLIGWAKSG